jgi:hypothetical protein
MAALAAASDARTELVQERDAVKAALAAESAALSELRAAHMDALERGSAASAALRNDLSDAAKDRGQVEAELAESRQAMTEYVLPRARARARAPLLSLSHSPAPPCLVPSAATWCRRTRTG